MTRIRPGLLNDIYELLRGDLDQAVLPLPDPSRLVREFSFVRLRRVSRPADLEDERRRVEAFESFRMTLSGLYGVDSAFVLLLLRRTSDLEVWLGASREVFDVPAWQRFIQGCFPDSRFREDRPPDGLVEGTWREGVTLLGAPDPTLFSSTNPLDALCRTGRIGRWCYLVYARPKNRARILQEINAASERITAVHAGHLIKGSLSDEENRVAKRLVDLLGAQLRRLEEAFAVGLWDTEVFILGEDPRTVRLLSGLSGSMLSTETAGPNPVRIRPCSEKGDGNHEREPLTSNELAVLARPPDEAQPGYEIIDAVRFGLDAPYSAERESALVIGEILDRGRGTGSQLSIPVDSLARHALIAGVTGSGKTTTCFAVLEQLQRGPRAIPFLVVESAKSEYRQLLGAPGFEALRLFTVGDERISPLRLNPFEVPEGTLVQTHVDYLKSLFSAAFVLYPPMPYVLEQSIHEVYEDRGWDLATNHNHRGLGSTRRFPTLSDLAEKVTTVVGRMGYDRRISMDVEAGLLARIDQLRLGGGKGRMFDIRSSTPSEVLFAQPCVLELKQIASDEEKAFLIGFRESLSVKTSHGSRLQHLTLIEEAHRLLRNASPDKGNEVSPNPQGKAIEVFSNILSEIRAFGGGVVIAEQIPAKLTPDAVKNSTLKIVHRLVAADDRDLLGSSMGLDESQCKHLATLEVGEAVTYTTGMQIPALVRIPPPRMPDGGARVTDRYIQEKMRAIGDAQPGSVVVSARCSGCPGLLVSAHCGRRIPIRRAERPRLHTSFLRLFNAMRLNKAIVVDAFLEFETVVGGLVNQGSKNLEVHCVARELLEKELDERGQFGAWPFEAVDGLLATGQSVFDVLIENVRSIERKKLAGNLRPTLTRFARSMQERLRVSSGPLPGCRVCSKPCMYRFDVQGDKVNPERREFMRHFLDPKSALRQLADICWGVARQRFLIADTMSLRGSATCFAVQMLGGMDLTRQQQQDLAASIDRVLRSLPENTAKEK